ncbi:MAG: hypothetical protein ABEI31_03065 [Halodesulfurarchaeum sp.]
MSRQEVAEGATTTDEVAMVTTYFRNVMGEHLRLVAAYDPESVDIEYVRDDLQEEVAERDVADWIDPLLADAENASAQERRVRHGSHRSAIHVFDEILLFHYPTDGERNLVVSVDPAWIEDVFDHVATCRQLMQ